MRRGGDGVARVVLDIEGDDGEHRIEVGFQPGEAKHLRVDASPVDSLSGVETRPLVSVFLPERLDFVKGAPSARRAHLDQVVAALWPSRAETRGAYSRALAQRNALLARIRAGAAGPTALDAWDHELARLGIALMENRSHAVGPATVPFARLAQELGLPGEAALAYRPRSGAEDAGALGPSYAARDPDLQRGFSATARTATSSSCSAGRAVARLRVAGTAAPRAARAAVRRARRAPRRARRVRR